MAEDLLQDEKELAEHRMLVDLGRNDVGRVAEYGSVRVPDLMVVEKYSHVMHIVSQVEGRLREGLGAIDVFRACFPAGTLSGKSSTSWNPCGAARTEARSATSTTVA